VSNDGSDDATRFGTQAFYAGIGRAFVVMCATVPFLAVIVFANIETHGAINSFAGIRPHDVAGLDGILLAPFVHDGWAHLLANSTPLILLGTFVLAGGAKRFLWATLIIAICSGLGVWLVTQPGYLVVGASGVIFGWLGLLFMRGIVERSLWNLAVAVIAGLLYGWQLQAVLPTEERVSWQGHLFGFLGGLLAAILVRRARPAKPRPAGLTPGLTPTLTTTRPDLTPLGPATTAHLGLPVTPDRPGDIA
jgi:membrane associated rhomboid family serine protease